MPTNPTAQADRLNVVQQGLGSTADRLALPSAYLLLICILVGLFGGLLTGRERLGYRDTSHFYTPLYQYLAERQRDEWLPLWNPHDGTGLPLLGESSTAVVYPVRWFVFAVMSDPVTAMGWYVVLHLFLAAVFVQFAAQGLGASSLGQAIALLCYPLSGAVLFNIHNVPYLVAAAWLPLVISGFDRLSRRPQAGWIGLTAVGLAMMVQGGDPQTALHATVFAWGWLLWRSLFRLRLERRLLCRCLLATLAACVLAGLIAAVQIAASCDWTVQSNRVAAERLGASESYAFSAQPWHWLELFVPFAGGNLWPSHTRLSQSWVHRDSMWIMTLYVGLVPILLCLTIVLKRLYHLLGIIRGTKPLHAAWREPRLGFGLVLVAIGLGFAMPGPYAWLGDWVPGYGAFRYAAKWLVFGSLGLSLTAALSATQWSQGRLHQFTVTCVVAAVIYLALAAVTMWLSGHDRSVRLLTMLNSPDRYWGPFQATEALQQIAWSSAMATLSCMLLWWICRLAVGRYPFVLLIVAMDLFLVARMQTGTISRGQESLLLDSIRIQTDDRVLRVSSGSAWPSVWQTTSDAGGRPLQVAVSERATWFSRWHLAGPHSVFNSQTSIRSKRLDWFWEWVTAQGQLRESSEAAFWHSLESWLGITARLVVTGDSNDTAVPIASARLQVKPERPAVVHWYQRWQAIEPQQATKAALHQRLSAIVDGKQSEWCVVETTTVYPPSAGDAARVTLLRYRPEQVIVEVEAKAAGLLTFKSLQDGNWTARVLTQREVGTQSNDVDVVPVDFLFMGVMVPAGKHQVIFEYRPPWLPLVGFASLCGYGLALGMVVPLICGGRRRSDRPVPSDVGEEQQRANPHERKAEHT